jgi:hypothetical protein
MAYVSMNNVSIVLPNMYYHLCSGETLRKKTRVLL